MGASLPGSPSVAAPWTPLGMEAASQMFHCRISGVIPACSRGWEPRFHGGPPSGVDCANDVGVCLPRGIVSPTSLVLMLHQLCGVCQGGPHSQDPVGATGHLPAGSRTHITGYELTRR